MFYEQIGVINHGMKSQNSFFYINVNLGESFNKLRRGSDFLQLMWPDKANKYNVVML